MKKDKDENIFSNLTFVIVLTLVFLLIGILGFHIFDKSNWVNAFYDTCSTMSVVGASHGPTTDCGKIFGGLFSLASGLVYIFLIGYFIVYSINKDTL